ncbi:DUF2892 domain-containing protein [Hyphomicrobium sp. 1Nfss2.1]|uniref:YgaP family membrane protein n=1 Tax=Hyphomicrobium sp. 1Nfss2.1 TaxID=3413936 RepID=UPI003C7CA7C5
MAINEGGLDRAVRIIAGLLLLGVALGLYGPEYQSIWGWIGVVPLITGVFGRCPVYSLLGINTCSKA